MTQPTTPSLIPLATRSFLEHIASGMSESAAMSNVTAFYDLSLDQAIEVMRLTLRAGRVPTSMRRARHAVCSRCSIHRWVPSRS
jgi:hypothetical protein